MRFSVIIPTFDRRALLEEALVSVDRQTFRDFEIIVCDDGSADGTSEWLNRAYPHIKRVHIPNGGPSQARNAAANIADGEYLAFLDSDDTWFPWTLATFAKVVELTAANVIGGCADYGARATKPVDALAIKTFDDFIASRGSEYVGAESLVVKRTQFEAVGGFWQFRWNAEDHDLLLRLGTAPTFVKIMSPATVHKRQTPGSLMAQPQPTLNGVCTIVSREKLAVYPGGFARARERRAIITLHVRPLALSIPSVRLYKDTFCWHVRQGRWRFLFAFPLVAAFGLLLRSR